MSQLNSSSFSLACDWNFAVEGDPSTSGVAGKDLGLTLQTGVLVTSAYYNVLTPLVTAGNPAVDTLSIFYLNNNVLLRIVHDTIANINLIVANAWMFTTRGQYVADQGVVQNPTAIATPGVYQFRVASTAVMTAGRIAVCANCIQLDVH